jgi:hypothetical protein
MQTEKIDIRDEIEILLPKLLIGTFAIIKRSDVNYIIIRDGLDYENLGFKAYELTDNEVKNVINNNVCINEIN